jgi:hypothetical protein
MKTSQTPLTPVAQSTVTIAGYEIIVVLLPGGQVAAAFRMFCEMLRLNYSSQLRKVRAHHTIGTLLLSAYIETSGGKQEANVIIAEAIPIWLAEIHETKVSPEAEEILRICQLDAVRTIRQKFFLEVAAEAEQTLPPKEEPAQAVPPREEPESAALPPPEEEYSYWDHMAAAQIGLEQEIRELVAFKKQVNAQMGQIIEVVRQLTERVDRLEAGIPLTAVHQAQLQVLIRAWAHQSGQSTSAIEGELAGAFRVETISQLTEAAWSEMMAGFQERLGWSV